MAINLDHQRNKIASTSEVLTINNTGSLIVPKGTTVQRPGTEEGQIRYNSNSLKLEQYVNNNWSNISSVSASSDLSDITVTNPTIGHFLKYTGNNKFENEMLKLTSLNDVTITGTPLDKQVLKYDNNTSVFKPYTLELNDLSDISYSGTPAQDKILKTNNSGTFVLADPYTSASFDTDFATKELNDLNNVSGTPQTGYFLKWTGSGWEPAAVSTIGSSNLNDLGDVSAGSPSTGHFLKWNGTNWVNDDIPTPSLTLGQLSNVQGEVSGSPADNQLLQYNSQNTRWEYISPYTGGTGVSVSNTNVITINASTIDHNSLSNYVLNEHRDWQQDQNGPVIHPNNYTNSTYQASDFNHDDLANVPTNDHIDWTVNQSSNNYEIDINNYTNWRLDQPGATLIHPNNYVNTTYVDSDFNHDLLSGVVAKQHIDWTVSQTGNNYIVHSDNINAPTYQSFQGATTTTNGSTGLVPAPTISERTYFLKADGTWDNPAGNYVNTTYTLGNNPSTDELVLTGSDSTTNKVQFAGSNGISVTTSAAQGSGSPTFTFKGDHDLLINYVSAEHIDWSSSQQGSGTVIHPNNYVNTTYTGTGAISISNANVISVNAGQISHNNLSNVTANEHIDWTVSQSSYSLSIHPDNIQAVQDTTYDLTPTFSTSNNRGRIRLIGSDNTSDDFYIEGAGDNVLSYNSSSRVFTLTGSDTTYSAGSGIQFNGTQINAKASEIDHNSLLNHVANEHIDWTADQGGTDIHPGNYTNTQYTVFTSTDNGLVPYPPTVTADKFLAANGQWIDPSSSSTFTGITEGDAIAFVIALGG